MSLRQKKIIEDYFDDYQIFHDCLVQKLSYNMSNSKMILEIEHQFFEKELGKKKLIFKIEFESILKITIGKHPIVDEENYHLINWKNYFKLNKKYSLLKCSFENSSFDDFSTKNIKKCQ